MTTLVKRHRIPFEKQEEVNQLIKGLHQLNIIESSSDLQISSVMLVTKKS